MVGFPILSSLKFCFPCRRLGYIFANCRMGMAESLLPVFSPCSQLRLFSSSACYIYYRVSAAVLGITIRGGSNFSYKITFFFHYEEISNLNDYVISVFQLPYNNTSKTHKPF